MSPIHHKILMLYTGGTIGMVKDMEKGTFKPFEFQTLLDQIPELNSMDCAIEYDSLDEPIDSSNMNSDHWFRLAKRISRDYHLYDGFVILHGSDTMAYTASALSFMLKNHSKPIILTGSQLPIGVMRSDARENLLTSIEIAVAKKPDGSAMVPEVAVYFEYDLYRGNRCHKLSAEDFEAFRSMNYPPLATVGVNIKYSYIYLGDPSPNDIELADNWSNEVGILSVFPGISPAFVESVFNSGMKGFIIRTFGSGNAPTADWFLKAIKEQVDKGIPIVNISQCIGGMVELGKYEASEEMRDIGVISGKDMTLEAGLTKMMYLLPKYDKLEDFREAYEANLRGELTDSGNFIF